jgi:hypothetical protein
VVYKVVVFCSRSRLGPLETLLLGQVLWCFVRKEKSTAGGAGIVVPRWKKRKIERKERREVRSKDRRKVPGRPYRRPVQSGEATKDEGKKEKEISVKDGSRCLLMFGRISIRPSRQLVLALSVQQRRSTRVFFCNWHTSAARTSHSSSVGVRRLRGKPRIQLVRRCCEMVEDGCGSGSI